VNTSIIYKERKTGMMYSSAVKPVIPAITIKISLKYLRMNFKNIWRSDYNYIQNITYN